MRLTDYMALACHGLRRGVGTASVLFTAAAVTALCFSGTLLAAIHSEKTEPCELSIVAPSYLAITEQSVQDFQAITDVVDATGIVEVPVTAKSGEYAAGLTLVGIDGDYLDDLVYTTGETFPAGGAMPWIALSKAAAQSFIDPSDKTKRSASYMPDIDWLGAEFSLDLGESTVSARVSGLFESDEPVAYIGQSIAKMLLQNQGQASSYTGARVRVTNIGTAESVSKTITGLGYEVEERDSARQEKWDAQTREAVYLAILAAAGFICVGSLQLAGSAADKENDQHRVEALRWAGMSSFSIKTLHRISRLYQCLLGIGIGIVLYLCIKD